MLKPVVAQYEPAVHGLAAAKPATSHSEPIGHAVACELPVGQKVVSLHLACVAADEPLGHA